MLADDNSPDARPPPGAEPALLKDARRSPDGSGRWDEFSAREGPATGNLPSAWKDSVPCRVDSGDEGGDVERASRDGKPAMAADKASAVRLAASFSAANVDEAGSVAAVETGDETGREAPGTEEEATALRLGGRTTTPLRARLSARDTCEFPGKRKGKGTVHQHKSAERQRGRFSTQHERHGTVWCAGPGPQRTHGNSAGRGTANAPRPGATYFRVCLVKEGRNPKIPRSSRGGLTACA